MVDGRAARPINEIGLEGDALRNHPADRAQLQRL